MYYKFYFKNSLLETILVYEMHFIQVGCFCVTINHHETFNSSRFSDVSSLKHGCH